MLLDHLKNHLMIHIDISQNLSNSFELKLESKAQIKTPKSDDDKTALLSMETIICIPDSHDFDINMSAEFVFEFDIIPSDYNLIAKEKCIPLAQKELLRTLDVFLVEMGYKKLNLAEK